jgi:hypothetical protein
MTTDRRHSRWLLAAMVMPLAVLSTGCSRDPVRTPSQPMWFTSNSPTGRVVECIFVGDYGGLRAESFQAEMQCWEVAP